MASVENAICNFVEAKESLNFREKIVIVGCQPIWLEMFPSSSQRRYWTFRNEDEIRALRKKHNQEFQQYHGDRLGLNVIFRLFLL